MKVIAIFLFLLLLAACSNGTSEIVSQSVSDNIDVVAEESDLPECTEDDEGEQVMVKGESYARTCVSGEWTKIIKYANDTASVKRDSLSCHTEELASKRGVKVVCYGDSVGVLLNAEAGAKGSKGDAGVGCSLERVDSTSIRLYCEGDSTMYYLKSPSPALDADSATKVAAETVPVSFDLLMGFAQKGPFMKGAMVDLFELKDGITLEKTGRSFKGEVVDDEGLFKISKVKLSSQYAIIKVKGFYRNEVTGQKSEAPVELYALVNLLEQRSPRVNVLTHLEFDRVNYLVTHEGKTVKQAKKQAQSEILKSFYMDVEGVDDPEGLDIFGDTEADAALLTISILLQGGRSESEIQALLTEISTALKVEGKWEGARADSLKVTMADGAMLQDSRMIREHKGNGNFYKNAGKFERNIEQFIADVYSIVPCGETNDKELQTVKKESSVYYSRNLLCYEGMFGITSENTYFNPEIEYGWMYDVRDRHVYKTVQITEKTWMAENLNFMYKIVVGDSLVLYENHCFENSCDTCGMYYTWAAAMDSAAMFSNAGENCGDEHKCNPVGLTRGVCPQGWHLPNVDEFETLLLAVGISEPVTEKVMYRGAEGLSALSGWRDKQGSDEFGFSAVGLGILYQTGKMRNLFKEEAIFWSSSEWNDTLAYQMRLRDDNGLIIEIDKKPYATPIRCVKD
jgi:uncharacterized protein (TIGR02145 family)